MAAKTHRFKYFLFVMLSMNKAVIPLFLLVLLAVASAATEAKSDATEVFESPVKLVDSSLWFYKFRNDGNETVQTSVKCKEPTKAFVSAGEVLLGAEETKVLVDLPPGGTFTLEFEVGTNEYKSCVLLVNSVDAYHLYGTGILVSQGFPIGAIIALAVAGLVLIGAGAYEWKKIHKHKLGGLFFVVGFLILVVAILFIIAADMFL